MGFRAADQRSPRAVAPFRSSSWDIPDVWVFKGRCRLRRKGLLLQARRRTPLLILFTDSLGVGARCVEKSSQSQDAPVDNQRGGDLRVLVQAALLSSLGTAQRRTDRCRDLVGCVLKRKIARVEEAGDRAGNVGFERLRTAGKTNRSFLRLGTQQLGLGAAFGGGGHPNQILLQQVN